jgi:hypothetical protein
MNTMLIFTLGSNMSCRRLNNRCISAVVKKMAFVEGYRLIFNKKSSDGSAKANIENKRKRIWFWGPCMRLVRRINPSRIF